MLKVWLDIDGVIADFEQYFLKYLNLPLHPPSDWEDTRFKNNIDLVNGDDFFWENIPPLIKSSEITYPISGYCTARNCNNKTILKWLDKHNFPKAELVNVGKNGSKGKILLAKGCNVMIDDSIKNFVDINLAGVLCYLHTRNHNLKEDVGHFRVNNMQEFMKQVKKLHALLYEQELKN